MRRILALAALFGALAGCESRHRGVPMVPASFDGRDAVPYGPLTRDDLRGSASDGYPLRPEEEKAPSAVCTKILVHPGSISTRSEGGAYVASLEAPSFFAVMGRSCSWWRANGELSDEHVLEHGQIHFAIAELEARRLNARQEDIVRQVHAVGTDPTSVTHRAQEELRLVLERAEKAASDRSTVFEHQVGLDRVRQRAWLHKITAELEVTRSYARGPQTTLPRAPASVPKPAPASVSTPALAPSPAPASPSATVAPAPAPPPMPPSSTGSFAD